MQVFVGTDDEVIHKVVCKICSDTTSKVFMIRVTRTGETHCKKVIKEYSSETEFKKLQNSMKDIGLPRQLPSRVYLRLARLKPERGSSREPLREDDCCSIP